MREMLPIACAGWLLSLAESRSAPVEGECLALVWAVHEKFRHSVHRRCVHLHTDQAPLKRLKLARLTNSKSELWPLKLQEFDYTIAYVLGTKSVFVGCLSRNVAACALRIRRGTWKALALKQVDDIAYCICAQTAEDDTVALCEVCDRPYCLCCITLLLLLLTLSTGVCNCPGCDAPYNNLKVMHDKNQICATADLILTCTSGCHRQTHCIRHLLSRRLALSLACNVQGILPSLLF